jgi:hypothetical protein
MRGVIATASGLILGSKIIDNAGREFLHSLRKGIDDSGRPAPGDLGGGTAGIPSEIQIVRLGPVLAERRLASIQAVGC